MCICFISAKDTYPLRSTVLRPGQPLDNCKYQGDEVEGSFHLGVKTEGVIVGIASFSPELWHQLDARNPYRLRGMATAEAVRGQGYGRKLVEHGLAELKRRDCDLLWFNAREVAFGFYEKLGFQYGSEMFEIPLIGPHRVMYMKL